MIILVGIYRKLNLFPSSLFVNKDKYSGMIKYLYNNLFRQFGIVSVINNIATSCGFNNKKSWNLIFLVIGADPQVVFLCYNFFQTGIKSFSEQANEAYLDFVC